MKKLGVFLFILLIGYAAVRSLIWFQQKDHMPIMIQNICQNCTEDTIPMTELTDSKGG